MKGLSVFMGRMLLFLLLMVLLLLLLPGLAGAQPEAEATSDEETAAAEEGDEPSIAEIVEDAVIDAIESTLMEPLPEPVEVLKYDYFILHSLEKDLPIQEWDILARIPADSNYIYDEPGYFGFFLKDPAPEKPMEPVEPVEPEEPLESGYPVDEPNKYRDALSEYKESHQEYLKNLKGYEKYIVIYPELLEKYESDIAEFNANSYPNQEHYYFFERDIPLHKPKKAIYRITITQPVKGALPVTAGAPSPTDILGAIPGAPEAPVAGFAPPPPLPDDLVFPEMFTYEDRTNDDGGWIALRWSTSSSDKLTIMETPEPAAEETPAEEKSSAPEPEFDLGSFIVDAWVFAPIESDEGTVKLAEPNTITVTANMSKLGGEKEFKLGFVGIVDNPSAFDYNLGYHYRGQFTSQKKEADIIGKHLIKAWAKVEGIKKTLRGQVNVRKIAGKPVNAIKNDDIQPDNMYAHYFKLGMDYSTHEGTPRWIHPMEPEPVIAHYDVFNSAKWNTILYVLLFTGSILMLIMLARKGTKLFVRRIAGLDHVEEAIGRATEMGKPILYIPGIGTMADVATIAATNILGQVTRKVAEYDSRIMVPCKDPIVMTVAQEVCQEAYIDAGHPDKYNRDDVFFLTDDQFAFTAAVNGIMVRDKPATILLMGMFFAESLILAETGASTGAIQIAGTDALHQLPFFITACDYTLIGEELYAASAYLSKEPLLLGSLKGQDMAKLFIFVIILIGVILATLGFDGLSTLFSSPL